MKEKVQLTGVVADHLFGKRLDQVIAEMFPDYSRSRLKEWILTGSVKVNDLIVNRAREKVKGGERIDIQGEIEVQEEHKAENITLDIAFEDEDILVINKPKNLVVHPGAGNTTGTLLNAVLHHCPEVAALPRAGIVHRLDKDTTGLMVVAKTIPAQTHLVEQLQRREFVREYEAVVNGTMTAGGKVEQPIGRHPTKRTLMAVTQAGRPSITHYRVAEKFRNHTFLRLRLETGRTHQIRVHMAHIGHALVGDIAYGGKPRPPKGASDDLIQHLRSFPRQALNAAKLGLAHPVYGDWMEWEIETPADIESLVETLRADTQKMGLESY